MRGRGKKVRKNWLTSFIFMDGPTKVVFRNSFDVATAGHCKNPMLYQHQQRYYDASASQVGLQYRPTTVNRGARPARQHPLGISLHTRSF